MTRIANYADYTLWMLNTSESTPTLQGFKELTISQRQSIATIVDRWNSQQ